MWGSKFTKKKLSLYCFVAVKFHIFTKHYKSVDREIATKSHKWCGASTKSGSGCCRASTIIGNNQHPQHDRGSSGQNSTGICLVVVCDALSYLVPGVFYRLAILLPEWRSMDFYSNFTFLHYAFKNLSTFRYVLRWWKVWVFTSPFAAIMTGQLGDHQCSRLHTALRRKQRRRTQPIQIGNQF